MHRLLLCLLLSLCAGAAFAENRYVDLHKVVEPVAKLAGLRYVSADLRVKSTNATVKPETIAFTIRASGGDITVPVDADGRLVLPITDALVAENPVVVSNQPEGSLEISVSFDVRADPQQTFDYALLDAMRREYDEVVGRQKLMWRLFAPDGDGLLIRFPKGSEATVTVALANGPVRYAADEKDEVRLPNKAEWRRQNPRIETSVKPEKVALNLRG